MAYRAKAERKVERLEPPQALDAERDVLGSILKDPEAINRVIEVFDDPSHFYSPAHRTVFEAILELYGRNQPCDITMVANELVRKGVLDKIGGRTYLVDLIEQVASTGNVASYAELVLEKSVLRSLISTSNEIIHSCYVQEKQVDDLLDDAESNIFFISEKRLRKGFVPIKDLVGQTYETIHEYRDEGTGFGLSTGFDDLDALTNGLHNGDLIIVAGRPSMGKTSLALNIVQNVAVDLKKPVGFFSVEMSNEALILRMMSTAARVNQQRIRKGKVSDRDMGALSAAMNRLGKAEVFLDDSPVLSVLEMRAKARRLKAQHDVALIVVDYIQLMHASGRAENRQQEIAQISMGLKSLAKELDIPVIAISQLSRLVEQRGGEKRPQLSDLRESGAIEQDADLVMFVYRPEAYLSADERRDPKNQPILTKAEIIVAKQRNGETGSVNLIFLKEITRFENLERTHRELPPGAQPVDDGDVPF
ncbi:MAG: replicative DNA helicase [Candidatus Zixiibacteriota bacterium]|nr:MAG: replicative DNA helicase [candidate division Zixibacteria bacterium]